MRLKNFFWLILSAFWFVLSYHIVVLLVPFSILGLMGVVFVWIVVTLLLFFLSFQVDIQQIIREVIESE